MILSVSFILFCFSMTETETMYLKVGNMDVGTVNTMIRVPIKTPYPIEIASGIRNCA